MGGTAIKYGLVEMSVNLPERPCKGGAYKDRDAVAARLRQRCGQAKTDRLNDVLRILLDERFQDVDLLLFPGYTLPVGSKPIPKEVLEAVGKRTVVIETFGAGASKHGGKVSGARLMHVLHKGKALVKPVAQRITTNEDAKDGNRVAEVVAGLRRARRWLVRSHVRCGLIICGEVNVVKHSTQGAKALHDELETRMGPIDLVVNPAHTRTSLEAMRCKRDWLARGRVLLTSANLHGAVKVRQWRKKTSRWVRVCTSSTMTAEVFIGGSLNGRYNRERMVAELGAQTHELHGGHKVTVVEHAAIAKVLATI
ncbi:MAG: hypothetical protein EPO40_17550 [Myxococcaceae bacterium]|nr:MAG: hypothetical protein EPO40_17550 [Myxococcaceae bacterium]